MMIRPVHIPDDVGDAPNRLSESWSAAAQQQLSAIETVLAWLADPTHPIQRLVAAWVEMARGQSDAMPYADILAWMCDPGVYRRLARGAPEIDAIILAMRRRDFGVYQ